MATSITASNANAPFSNYLLQDSNYIVTTTTFPSASQSSSMTSLYFPNYEPPTSGKFVINLSNSAISGSAGSLTSYVSLQDSTDGVNFKNISTFTSSLLPIIDGGNNTAPANSVTVYLNPVQKLPNYYVRGLITVPSLGATAGGLTGSVTVAALF